MKINFPNNCDIYSIFAFCNEIIDIQKNEDIYIDFSSMGRVEPFTMVYLAKIIREIKNESPTRKIFCDGYQEKFYASNMGFFRAFGLKHGRLPNINGGNASFVPLSILRTQTVEDEARKSWSPKQDIIENKSAQLAKILAREDDSNLVDALTFSIREIMRNVIEHSESKFIEYCAQFWPTYNKVEIAISDNGIGLRKSLKNNPFIQVENDSDALQQALMPAISSKNYQGAIINRDDPWHNSGFGLYMINRICRTGGSFLICSGDHGILLNSEEKKHIYLNHNYQGTIIRMVLNTSKLKKLPDILREYRDEGYEIAKTIKGVGYYQASAASQMLSRDFKK